MERVEETEQVSSQSTSAGNASLAESSPRDRANTPLVPQQAIEPCPTCAIPGAVPPSFVYAIGEIDWLPSNESLDQEISQVLEIRKEELKGLGRFEAQKKILLEPENRYIVRQLCWVLRIETLQTYILQPRDPADYKVLVDAFRPHSRENIDVIIGVRGPIAPPEVCNGLGLPIVVFDQLYSFDREMLIKSIPKPPKAKAKEFEGGADDLFKRIQQMSDNHGATDEHRAVNYLAVRSSEIYKCAHDAVVDGYWLTSLDVVASRLSGSRGRRIFDVVLTYTNPTSRVARKWFWRVDVTGEYPFIVTGQQEYYDRS